jgi:lysyl-tRNA synthetase class 2
MNLVEALFEKLLYAVGLGHTIPFGEKKIHFSFPIPRVSYVDLMKQYCGIDLLKNVSDEDFLRQAQKKNIPAEVGWSRAKIIDELFKTAVRPNITDPMFVTDHPLVLSPLTKRHPKQAALVERFQLLIAGTELINAFSELNDPLDQRERFEAQRAMRQAGDSEAQQFDEDFIQALEYGMPPAAGLGMGIDRLTALLSNSHSVKEVIAFPLLRPKGAGNSVNE